MCQLIFLNVQACTQTSNELQFISKAKHLLIYCKIKKSTQNLVMTTKITS